MSRCEECAYRGEIRTGDVERTSCAYILITGHSRLKDAYRRLGVKELTKEVRKALEPANCRCYRKGTPQRDQSQTRVPLVSSDPVRAKATEARARANAARKKEEERERILKKEKRSYTKPDKPPTVDPVKGRELYDRGLNDREIAAATGISEKTAAKFRLDNGLPPHPRERSRKFDTVKARKLREQGLTDREIAEQLGVSKAAIWHWRRTAGITSVDYRKRPKGISWEETGRRMLKEGATDREIAEAVGRSVATVCSWRKRRGLDYPGRQKKRDGK